MKQTIQKAESDFADMQAFEEMYGSNAEAQNSTKAFLEMKQKQTQDINALRNELAASNQAVYHAQQEN